MVMRSFSSSSVGSSCSLHSSSFSSSSPSSSLHSSLSSSSFHSSSLLYSESLQQAQSVPAPPTSRHSTLPSQRAIVGREWSSSPSLASYSVACTALVGTSNIPPNQNKLSGKRRPWPSQSSLSSLHPSTSFWPLGTSVPAKSLNAESCSSSTSS